MGIYVARAATLSLVHPFTQALAATLRAERGASRLTIRGLADASGVPLRSLVRYLDGARELPMSVLVMLADSLGVKPSHLLAEAERRLANDEE